MSGEADNRQNGRNGRGAGLSKLGREGLLREGSIERSPEGGEGARSVLGAVRSQRDEGRGEQVRPWAVRETASIQSPSETDRQTEPVGDERDGREYR